MRLLPERWFTAAARASPGSSTAAVPASIRCPGVDSASRRPDPALLGADLLEHRRGSLLVAWRGERWVSEVAAGLRLFWWARVWLRLPFPVAAVGAALADSAGARRAGSVAVVAAWGGGRGQGRRFFKAAVSVVLEVASTGESHVGSAGKTTATSSGAAHLLGGVVMVLSHSGRLQWRVGCAVVVWLTVACLDACQ